MSILEPIWKTVLAAKLWFLFALSAMSFIRVKILFLRKRATLPSAFSGSAFSYKLAQHKRFSDKGLLCLLSSFFAYCAILSEKHLMLFQKRFLRGTRHFI